MPDLSAKLAELRLDGHQLRGHLSFFNPGTVWEMTVDSTPSSFPVTDLTVTTTSGGAASAFRGARVDVEDSSGNFKGRTRIRFSGTLSDTALPIRELSQADIDVAATDVIKVYNEPMLSDKLVEADEAFAPDGVAYSDQGDDPVPISNSGGPWFGELDKGAAVATIQMTGDTSVNVDPDSTPGNFAHLWTLTAGITFKAGSVNTDANPVLEGTAGTYLVQHRVTDSDNSKATTQRVPVRVHDSSDLPYECVVEGLSADEDLGWAMTVRIFENAGLSNVRDGALCCFWVDEIINSTQQSFGAASSGRSHMKMVGYVRRESGSGDGSNDTLTFEIISPLARLGELLGLSKVFIRESAPANWSEVKGLTTQRALQHTLQYYTTWIESGFDFIMHSNYVNYDFPAYFLQKASPLDVLREIADGTGARVVCDRSGRLEVQTRLEMIALGSR